MTTIPRHEPPPDSLTPRPPYPRATRYRFVGGKGGVGKTTCAAALAIAAAHAGLRTLAVSTDPAPSLGDALGHGLGPAPRRIALPSRGRRRPVATLHAAELDPRRSLERWLEERRAALERIAVRGTWLDEEDVTRLLRLSLPGIDEIAALLEISRLGGGGRYDMVVVDTAPTGHTLRMLAMPQTLLAVARVFDRMQSKHRVIVEALRGSWRPDADDELIDAVAGQARSLAGMLRDRSAVDMYWVTLPEPMAVAETLDAAAALTATGIGVSHLVVNRVTPEPPAPCRWCRARRAFERAAIASLSKHVREWTPKPAIRLVNARDKEPTGIRALSSIAASLDEPAKIHLGSPRPRLSAVVASSDAAASRTPTAWSATHLIGTAGLVLFGGKGGVGKTTSAAAAAIAAARREPARPVLLVSTDPAHSLGDALGIAIGNTSRAVPGAPANLRVRELDAAAGFQRVRDRYRSAIDALFDRISRSSPFDASHDRGVMQELINLAPPGIDELAAVIEVVDLLDSLQSRSEAPLIVVDTAPSGHALRLLEMPALVQDWAKALMSILLKYQPVVGIGELGAVLLKLSQGLGRLRALLADDKRTGFIIVSRAAALPRAETVRLLERLTALHVDVRAVVVNAVGAGDCARCVSQRSAERDEIVRLHRSLPSRRAAPQVLVAPAVMPPPRGTNALEAWESSWRTAPRRRSRR